LKGKVGETKRVRGERGVLETKREKNQEKYQSGDIPKFTNALASRTWGECGCPRVLSGKWNEMHKLKGQGAMTLRSRGGRKEGPFAKKNHKKRSKKQKNRGPKGKRRAK